MSELWRQCCCCYFKSESKNARKGRKPPQDLLPDGLGPAPHQQHSSNYYLYMARTPEDERKYPDLAPAAGMDEIDPGDLNVVKKKLRNVAPEDSSQEFIISQAHKYLSPSYMEKYFRHLVSGKGTNAVLEAADEMEASVKHSKERGMQQRRCLERLEAVVHFPVKLILCDLNRALPMFASTFSKMLQLEFGPLHAALVIDDVVLEWDDSSLVLPSTEEKEWVFQTRLQGNYNKIAQAMKPQMKDSARRMDLPRQIEQVFEVTKEKQQAISQLARVIVHYNACHEYNVLTRNCQHFVIDAMRALGVDEVCHINTLPAITITMLAHCIRGAASVLPYACPSRESHTVL